VASLLQRIRKLEACLTDGSGLKPRSPEWQEYWEHKLARIVSGDEAGDRGCIPLEVWDALTVAD
jgi:hypothetical protein